MPHPRLSYAPSKAGTLMTGFDTLPSETRWDDQPVYRIVEVSRDGNGRLRREGRVWHTDLEMLRRFGRAVAMNTSSYRVVIADALGDIVEELPVAPAGARQSAWDIWDSFELPPAPRRAPRRVVAPPVVRKTTPATTPPVVSAEIPEVQVQPAPARTTAAAPAPVAAPVPAEALALAQAWGHPQASDFAPTPDLPELPAPARPLAIAMAPVPALAEASAQAPAPALAHVGPPDTPPTPASEPAAVLPAPVPAAPALVLIHGTATASGEAAAAGSSDASEFPIDLSALLTEQDVTLP